VIANSVAAVVAGRLSERGRSPLPFASSAACRLRSFSIASSNRPKTSFEAFAFNRASSALSCALIAMPAAVTCDRVRDGSDTSNGTPATRRSGPQHHPQRHPQQYSRLSRSDRRSPIAATARNVSVLARNPHRTRTMPPVSPQGQDLLSGDTNRVGIRVINNPGPGHRSGPTRGGFICGRLKAGSPWSRRAVGKGAPSTRIFQRPVAVFNRP